MVLEKKNKFLACLSDEQLGFFCAHEYSPQLETFLQDNITYKQFLLFKEWKEEEEAQSEMSSYESEAINALSNRMESLFERMNARMDILEKKIESLSNKGDQPTNKSEKTASSFEDIVTQQADSMRNFASKINERMDNVEQKSKAILNKFSALETSVNTIEDNSKSNKSTTTGPVNERMDHLERALQELECAKTKLKIPKSVIGQLLEDSEFKRFTLPSDTKLYIEDISNLDNVATSFLTNFTLSNKEKSLLDRTISEIIIFLQKKNYLSVRRTLSPVIEKMINRWSLEERAVFQRKQIHTLTPPLVPYTLGMTNY